MMEDICAEIKPTLRFVSGEKNNKMEWGDV